MLRIVLTVIVLTTLCVSVAWAEFWGSSSSNRYHFKRCQWTQKIMKEYLVRFDTADQAVKAGYRPCEKCRPPLTEKRGQQPSPGQQQPPAR